MSLNWECFLDCVDHFLSVSSSINDSWAVVDQSENNLQKLPQNYYLFKKVIVDYNCALNHSQKDVPQIESFEENLEPDTSTVETVGAGSEALVWEYHILYSPSYSVPVLYFNVRNTAGRLLLLNEVWNIVQVPKELMIEKWSFVSQQEHPILLRPFFYLHPCKSFEFFKVNENSSVNPLVTWLSSIAHIVHLPLPLEYGNKPFIKSEFRVV